MKLALKTSFFQYELLLPVANITLTLEIEAYKGYVKNIN